MCFTGHKSEYFSTGKPDAGMKSMCAEIHNYVSCDRLLKVSTLCMYTMCIYYTHNRLCMWQ